ncbi:hypothetical protein AB0M29_23035 [Streptomyces sp. NPDC051976]|uniref:hypothetical protein n=1 Tax=Streptomyces sp. NPDC051976 TaxID=3154947 RepID=UPI00344739B9
MKTSDSTARAKPAEPDTEHTTDTTHTPGTGRASDTGRTTGPAAGPDATTAPDGKPVPDMRPASDARRVPVAGQAGGTDRDATSEAATVPVPEPAAASPAEEIDRLGRRMDRAVGGFVDDPRRAVREADSVLEETVSRLAALVEERQRVLRASWDPKGTAGGADDGPAGPRPGTEELRIALTRYRDLTRQLLSI